MGTAIVGNSMEVPQKTQNSPQDPAIPLLGIHQRKQIISFDLKQDIALLLCAKAEDVFRVPGVMRIAINRVPFLAEVNTLRDQDYERLGIDRKLCMSRYEEIIRHRTELILKIRSNDKDEFDNPDDVDFQIYSKFFSDYDKRLFSAVRKTPPEQN